MNLIYLRCTFNGHAFRTDLPGLIAFYFLQMLKKVWIEIVSDTKDRTFVKFCLC